MGAKLRWSLVAAGVAQQRFDLAVALGDLALVVIPTRNRLAQGKVPRKDSFTRWALSRWILMSHSPSS